MGTARLGAAGAVFNGKLYVFGGWNGTQNLASVEVYDPATNVWTTLASMPTPRQLSAAGVVAGIVYIAGGYSATSPLAILEAYTP